MMDNLLKVLEKIMDEANTKAKYAILSHAIHIKALRHDLRSFFKNDFKEILSPDFNVIPITNDDPDFALYKLDSEPSDYFYIFNNSSTIDHDKLCDILGLFNKLLVRSSKNNHKLKEDIERLIGFADTKKEIYRKGRKEFIPQIPMVDINFDNIGNVIGIHLLNCILLIRLSDHNVDTSKGDRRARNYKIRKSIVDNVCYYNVEDYLDKHNTKEKLGEKHMRFIEREFREKLRSANIGESLITVIIEKVQNIVRRHYGERIKEKG